MTSDCKKPGVGFWATVVLVVGPVLYALSVGPACWISSRANAGASAISVVYRPLTWGMEHSDQFADAVDWYSGLVSAKGWEWVGRDWTNDADGLDKWLYSPKYRAIMRNLGVD